MYIITRMRSPSSFSILVFMLPACRSNFAEIRSSNNLIYYNCAVNWRYAWSCGRFWSGVKRGTL